MRPNEIREIATISPMGMGDAGSGLAHLYRPIVFAEPERTVAPASWLDYTPFAFWIVDALRPTVFVELGCHSGNSYASFAQAVQALGLSTACYGVDTWRGDSQAGFFDERVFEEWSAYHDRRFGAFSQLVRATFDEASEHFADGSIDLIHLDGCHTFEAVTHDFDTWRPKLSQRSVLLCHDINVRVKDFGAWRLWDSLKDAYPSFEFLHGHGLGVLGIGRELPEAVQWLFSLQHHDPDAAGAVRLFFSRLGAAVVQRYRAAAAVEVHETELARRDEQLAHAGEDAIRLEQALADANEQVAHATADTSQLRAQVEDSNRQLATAIADTARVSGELEESNQRRGAAEAVGSFTRQTLDATEQALARRTAEVEALELRIGASKAELERRARHLDRFALTIATLHKHVGALSAALDAREAELTRVKRDLERVPRALSDRDGIIAGLDAEAAAALEAVDRHERRAEYEARRRTELEDVLAWSKARIASLCNPNVSPGARTSRSLWSALRSRKGRHRFQSAAEPALSSRRDELQAIEVKLTHCLEQEESEPRSPDDRIERIRSRKTSRRVQMSVDSLRAERRSDSTIVVVSHVGPWRPKAGNEYRVRRMLEQYRRQGYRVIPVMAPLPGEEMPREALEGIAAEFGNAVQCHRDGRVEYLFRDAPDALAHLNGTFTASLAALLGEAQASLRQRELIQLERSFCHDVVASTVLHLSRTVGPHILQVEYIWMTRLLPLVHGDVLKVVDTHDVFSSIPDKVAMFGMTDVAITPDEEAERLRRADLAIAIQDDERAALARLAPSVRIVTAGVDFDVVSEERQPTAGQILFVASDNARNRKGLDDFLRLAWPRIHRLAPHAALRIVGSVGDAVAARELPGVIVVGRVDDLSGPYREAELVINPAVAGTGLKIKVLEALSHCRPVVTWPAGVEGLAPELTAFCSVARDWYEFSEHVIHQLAGSRGERFSPEARAVVARHLAPEHVYAPLDAAFDEFFLQHRRGERGDRVSSEFVAVGHAGN